MTFDTAQTRSLLEGRKQTYVPYVAPRDLVASARAARHVSALLKGERFDACISTGSAVAGLALPLVALSGVPSFYVESVARFQGPSLTGRIMHVAPRVRTLTQSPAWASSRWAYEGTILDGWESMPHDPADRPRGVLVTLGTIRPYTFDRAIAAVLPALRPTDEVVWQLGVTPARPGLPGRASADLQYEQMSDEVRRADVVISHAGVGSVLLAYQWGKYPVLATRSARHSEHVDEHQRELADALIRRDLAAELDLDDPNRNAEVLDRAARRGVRPALTERTPGS
ncbi:glycosyltransferase [Microbacterium sp. B19]|uniref:glycosyltransferase n=1 Tax=Microbacterium sp. B19 TaxID=96765 RepID=UPI00034758CD|nr:glycosyltransferase [Microbacterium sp. B19]